MYIVDPHPRERGNYDAIQLELSGFELWGHCIEFSVVQLRT